MFTTQTVFDRARSTVLSASGSSSIERNSTVSEHSIITDDGTAWELGFAYALGKPIIGVHTDWRRRFDHEVINLMIECSLTVLLRSLDELPAALRSVLGEVGK